MQNNIKKTMLLGLSAVSLFTACNKQLDIVPEGAPTKANFWKTEADAISASNALYALYDQSESFYGRGLFWFINASDDMVTGRANAQADNMKNFSRAYIGGSYTENNWVDRFIIIKRANDIIRYVPAIQMSAAIKNRVLGEAYFNSAVMNYELAANYGDDRMGVPIVTVENMDHTEAVPRAANITENYKHAISQFKKAADLLPFFDTYAAADQGRAHKVAAWGYLSKTYLYMKDYANAELYADSVINFGKRRLEDNYKDVFTTARNYGTEYIWSVTSSAAGPDGWGSILPGVMLTNGGWGKYNGWGYYLPTKELYDAYETGDIRREATILKPGDKFMYFGVETTFAPPSAALSDYQFNKYMEPFSHANPIGTYVSPNGDHNSTSLNVPLMRYAEILLIKAEAAINLRGNGAGDTQLNMIRRRAGLTPKTGLDMTELKNQRRCELAGEFADRHRDLIRWGDAAATYAKALHDSKGKVIWAARKFDPKIHHVWLVPQREIDNSRGIIKQNEGW
ncbi:RagB/SusD family nutrient uptake outer membrane protein [Sphingobacterium spiritivorum]|uniref:RagB/SusD family nutrient uptake outer membrane protein n=1 Tax=Sphingobacterium spiritivorum TaxID=258 RepID=UPI003DA4446A